MDFKFLVVILMSAALVNNYVLIKFLAVCPWLGVSKDLKNAVGMSCAVIFVMIMASAVTWPVYVLLLAPNGLGFLLVDRILILGQ